MDPHSPTDKEKFNRMLEQNRADNSGCLGPLLGIILFWLVMPPVAILTLDFWGQMACVKKQWLCPPPGLVSWGFKP